MSRYERKVFVRTCVSCPRRISSENVTGVCHSCRLKKFGKIEVGTAEIIESLIPREGLVVCPSSKCVFEKLSGSPIFIHKALDCCHYCKDRDEGFLG